MSGALTGLKVLDLSRVLAGPYCTQMLGDMGADVIKIEKPFAGDDTRFWGPPFSVNENGDPTKESAYYLSVNRNKKSAAIDVTTAEGRDVIFRLLETSDVLIENFRSGGLAKYGLAYHDLKDRFPRLVYCSITGFGQNGPLAAEPGYDLVAQAAAGLMASTGEADGAPMKTGVAVGDILTGLHATVAILAALRHRDQTGLGQHIDLSLFDCTLASMTNLAQYYLTSGSVAPRQGNAHSTIAPYQAFKARDGWLVIAVGNDTQFLKLCRFLNAPHLADDPRYKTNAARVMHKDALAAIISDFLADRDVADIVTACRALDIPSGPVNTLDRSFAEPQASAREMKIDLAGISLVGSPLKFSQTPVGYDLAPPTLGQDTKDVLKQLDLSDSEIDALAESQIIQLG